MPGPSIAERMASFMKPEAPIAGAVSSPGFGLNRPEPQGKRLHAAMVERETVVVGMVRYAKRFAVLYSDPLLGLYVDESGAVLKGSRSLAGCTASHAGQVVKIVVQNEKPIKLRAATVEEAQAWVSQIEAACPPIAPSLIFEAAIYPSSPLRPAAGSSAEEEAEAATAPATQAPPAPAAAAAATVPKLQTLLPYGQTSGVPPLTGQRRGSAALWAEDHTMSTTR